MKMNTWCEWICDGDIGFTKYLRGKSNELKKKTGRISQDTSLFLRLKKQGIEYTGSWSLDGTSWSNVGTHLFLNLNARQPSFVSFNSWHTAPEVGVRFDFVEIKRLP